MIEFKEEDYDELRTFSSGLIQNEVLTINSEHPYSVDYFERKSKPNISPSDQIYEKQEEWLTYSKEEHHVELRKFLSVPIKNKLLTINTKHPSSTNHFERKFLAKMSPFEKGLGEKKNNLFL